MLGASFLSFWAAVVVVALGCAAAAGRARGAPAGAFPHRPDLTGPATIAPIASHAAPTEDHPPLPIRLMLADVDGTLVTQEKVLTDGAIAAVGRLRDAGVLFAVTSGRPPRGMAMLVDPLDLQTPIAAFNGGLLVDRDMNVLEQRVVPEDLVVPVADHMTSFKLAVWLYRGAEWYVPDPKGPHVDRGGLDGQVRAQGDEGVRRADRQRREAGGGERRPRCRRRGGPRRRARSSATT